MQHGQNWPPADFWTLRLPHRPENFCLPQKVRFSPTRSPAPPFIFFDNGLVKKKKIFCLRYEHMYLENIPLKWCYFVYLAQNGKKIHNWDFPQMGFLLKKILVTFYCCFFSMFFSKIVKKVKVTNLTKNGQNYQILLETCFLRYLDTIW